MTHEELAQRWPRARAVRARDLVSRLDLCGCGNPSAAWRVIKHLLDRAENHARYGSFYDVKEVSVIGYDDPVPAPALPWLEFGAKVLDAWGLTEHGSGIGNAWLTEDGHLLLDFLGDFGVSGDSALFADRQARGEYWPVWAEDLGWTAVGVEPGLQDAYEDWRREMISVTNVNGKDLTPPFQIPKFLGATDVTADYKGQSADWFALQLIEKYGPIDGGEHHKLWVLDQVARILLGTPVTVFLARWDDGTSELLYQTGEPSAVYRAWARTMNYEDATPRDEGIAP